MGKAKEVLVSPLRELGGAGLRDAWLFDETGYEALYLREDVESKVAEIEVERYIDNERYGYVTRETYESLHYTEYEFTIRGFDAFVQYRTFVETKNGDRLGVMASFDPDVGVDFRDLTERLTDGAKRSSVSVTSGDA
jgi:hypothetical protein